MFTQAAPAAGARAASHEEPRHRLPDPHRADHRPPAPREWRALAPGFPAVFGTGAGAVAVTPVAAPR